MRDNTRFLFFALLLLALLFIPACDKNERPVPTLEETLTAICARKGYADSLESRYEVDTLARILVEDYMVYDSSFSQKTGDYQPDLERRYNGPVEWNPIATGIEINLDADKEEEIICFLGSYYSSPHVMVFDNVNGEYKKILDEYLWLHNEYPRLKFLKIRGKNIFRTGKFYYRGSGHWLYAYQCYAMIDGQVKQIAEFPYRANSSLGTPIMSTCNLKSDSVVGDNYMLTYSYSAKVSNQFMQSKLDSGYQEFEIVENSPLSVQYTFDNRFENFLPDNELLVSQLMSFDDDTCAFELIEPYLKRRKPTMYKVFQSVFQGASCSR